MAVRATVRVRAASRVEKPETAQLEAAARALTANGFSVLRIGRFGISVEGTVEDFHRAFGVTVESGKALVSTVAPAAPGLSAIDLVEVASSPTTLATTNQ